MRHDMAKVGEKAELFTPDGVEETRCVGCHALSRDGSKIALRYNGGHVNQSNIMDVASGDRVYVGGQETEQWTVASFAPDNRHLVVSADAGLSIVDSDDGSRRPLLNGNFTHHDVSPLGDKIVYVEFGGGNTLNITRGTVMVGDLDIAASTITNQVVIDQGDAGVNNYYTAFSPDGKWVLFNKDESAASGGTSNENSRSMLYIAPADGSSPAFQLSLPSQAVGLTNSWPKWAPFVNQESGESVMWLTFSSKRPVGNDNSASKPQLWMAPFYPERQGDARSAPAFWLPFQDITHGNHIAQWTEVVVAID